MYKTGALTAQECTDNCTFTPTSVDVIEGTRILIVHELFYRWPFCFVNNLSICTLYLLWFGNVTPVVLTLFWGLMKNCLNYRKDQIVGIRKSLVSTLLNPYLEGSANNTCK